MTDRVSVRIGSHVLTCDRIDETHAIVRSIPPLECGLAWGDVVEIDREEVTARVESSPYTTRIVVVEAAGPRDLRALLDALARVAVAVEDWTVSLGFECASCGLGTPHPRHAEKKGPWMREHQIAFASEHDVDDALLAEWEDGGEGRKVIEIREAG